MPQSIQLCLNIMVIIMQSKTTNKPLSKSSMMYAKRLVSLKNDDFITVVPKLTLEEAIQGLKNHIDKEDFVPNKYKLRFKDKQKFKFLVDYWLGAVMEEE